MPYCPVDDWVAADASFDIKDYYPASLVMFTWKEKLHGFPWDWGSACLAYNKDMFDAASVAYPTEDWTFDDLLAVATKLTKDGEFGFDGLPSGNFLWPTVRWPLGRDLGEQGRDQVLGGHSEAMTALQMVGRLAAEAQGTPYARGRPGTAGPGRYANADRQDRHVPAVPMVVLTRSKVADSRWDVAPWPKGPVTRISGAVGSGYGIGRDSTAPGGGLALPALVRQQGRASVPLGRPGASYAGPPLGHKTRSWARQGSPAARAATGWTPSTSTQA